MGVAAVQRYFDSLGVYGATAFLVPMFVGISEAKPGREKRG